MPAQDAVGVRLSLTFAGDTLDDAMRLALDALMTRGESTSPSKGDCLELRGVLLEITNPRARLSRSESRGRAFSCLGEFCWYLSGTDELAFIEYYIPTYRHFSENGILFGAYGPRLLKMRGMTNQLESVFRLLNRKPSSRQAVIQLFNAEDIVDKHEDIPCTCSLQFFVRNDRLELVTNMRSNDAYLGLPHDVFCFTMLQELMARRLGVELGLYRHFVGSLHLYNRNQDDALQYMGEGWQPTTEYMPSMPLGDPSAQLGHLLDAEKVIRSGKPLDLDKIGLEKYWADLARLLQIFRYSSRERNPTLVDSLSSAVNNSYAPYLEKMRARVT